MSGIYHWLDVASHLAACAKGVVKIVQSMTKRDFLFLELDH